MAAEKEKVDEDFQNFGKKVFELTELPIQELSDKIDSDAKFRQWIQQEDFNSEYGFCYKNSKSICQSLLHRLGKFNLQDPQEFLNLFPRNPWDP